MITEKKLKEPYYNLKIIISKKGYTQNDVAEKIGMPRSTFNLKINRTKGRDFDLTEASKVAKVLNVKLDDFF